MKSLYYHEKQIQEIITVFKDIPKLDADDPKYQEKYNTLVARLKNLVEGVVNDGRNHSIAANFVELVKLPKVKDKSIYLLVGNQHVSKLKSLLERSDLKDQITYYTKTNRPDFEKLMNKPVLKR